MRKLVTIRQISDITPIPHADQIECLTIDGWKVVSKKSEFSPGDLCVFFEIDSVLPLNPIFEFLRKSSYIKNELYEGFRLKTVKMRGQISQGLALPIALFKNEPWFNKTLCGDLAEQIGVVKWEPIIPQSMNGIADGLYPSYVPKTDQERIQNIGNTKLTEWIGDTRTINWEVTEKIEGISTSYYVYDDTDFGVCTRNYRLKESKNNIQWNVQNKLDILNKIRNSGKSYAIQGELIGPGIQGNYYKLKQHEFLIFDIYDIQAGTKLSSFDRIKFCEENGLTHVPVINMSAELRNNVDEMLKLADGNSLINPNVNREGLVWKSIYDPNISFKTISNEYLLKEK
jgi:RNA ligase (TIGR02306 family)